MLKGLLIVGARPNFIKAAALCGPLRTYFNIDIVHTGQHYDKNMSDTFFKKFPNISPTYKFSLKKQSQNAQTAEIIEKFDFLCQDHKPDFVVVVGDVNSTLACGLVAKKLGIKLIHVEAGLRSFDMSMPEEINRRMVDHISDLLFVTEEAAFDNLIKENLSDKAFLIGDVMIDVLKQTVKEMNSLTPHIEHCLVTIHRRSNIENKKSLKNILKIINYAAKKIKVVFPIHPHTRQKINEYGLSNQLMDINVLDPLPYESFITSLFSAKLVISDSGSLQTECNYLNTPNIVLRNNTERIMATKQGCCVLAGMNPVIVKSLIDKAINGKFKPGYKYELDDGMAAIRIAEVINERL